MSQKIFCYGDSNTYGYAPSGPFGYRLPEEQTWPYLLGQLLNAEVFNAGENGRSVPCNPAVAAIELAAYSAHLPADCIVIMLGTNDMLFPPYLRAKETAGRMEVLLQYLQKEYSQTDLFLVSPVPVAHVPKTIEAESRLLSTEYRRVAEAVQVTIADASEWNIPLEWDGVHFTAEGHRLFAEKLADALRNGPDRSCL